MKWTTMCSLVVGVFCFFAPDANAATLYLDPHETEIYPGDSLVVAVRLDTDEGECVNVVDAVLTYDSSVLPVDISRGESIVPIWVEEPKIDRNNQRITFAGGIPNGYCGRVSGDPRLTNIVLEIIFQAPSFAVGIGERDDVADIAFSDETRVLLNDGAGSPAPLKTLGASMLVGKKPRNQVVDEWQTRIVADQQAPRPFSIELETDVSIYNGRYFISFNTTDKQSGLDHYEVMEEPLDDFKLFLWGATGAPWNKANSPYLLEDQTLNSTIRVKAVDKAGNEYIAIYIPSEDVRGASSRDVVIVGLFVAGALIVLLAFGSVFLYWMRLRSYVDFKDEEQIPEE